jgi:hypothetical protein
MKKVQSTKFIFPATNYDRMFVYVWFDLDDVEQCKFGEAWTPTGSDPVIQCYKRARDGMGQRKDRFDEGLVEVDSIWDVTDYTKKVGRCYKHSRVDDVIRSHVGFRKGNVGEIHTLPAEIMTLKVNEYFRSVGDISLVNLGLAVWQARTVEEVNVCFDLGKDVILLDLAPRSGKTTVAGAIIIETDSRLTVVTSYVLTSFTSFKNDFSRFEQFRELVLIDAGEDSDWLVKVKKALRDGKRVVLFLSLCKGGENGQRDNRIRDIFALPVPVLVILDEADHGAWRPGQADILKKCFRVGKDRIILMTGTNSERAVGPWMIDHVVSVTYPEMLVERNLTERSLGLKS